MRAELERNALRREQGRCLEWCRGILLSLRRHFCSCFMRTDNETVEVRAEYNSGFSGEVLIVGELLFHLTFF